MGRFKQIGIDVDVNRAIEQARESFGETENDILRRLLITDQRRIARKPNAVQQAFEAMRSRGLWCVEVKGERFPAANMKEAYKTLLLKLADRSEDFLDDFAGERSRSRRFVAKSPSDLYDTSPHLASDHAQLLTEDWYFDTNLSTEQVATRARIAARVAGLRYGDEIKLMENLRTI